jgi:hypothetical protein
MMLPPFKSLPVNWIDGMKINKEHLEQTDNYSKDSVRDAIALQINDFNFGLCPPTEEGISSLNLNISVDPLKIIRVDLKTCRAVTPGGNRIEFGYQSSFKVNNEIEKLTSELIFENTKENNFYVVLYINSFARIPFGQPDNDETPPRHPFVMPEYKIQILPESQINLSSIPFNSIILSKLQYIAGKMMVNKNFIPACTMVKCSSILLDEYFKLGNLLGETGKNISIIIAKINEKSQSSTLVKSCIALCNQVSDFIATNLGAYRWILSNQPPVYWLNVFLELAYKINITLNNLNAKDREELVGYICEWIEEGPSDFNEKMNKLIRSEYNHSDIESTLNCANDFMQMVYSVFNKLAQLDFIGKKKGEGAFVQERSTIKIIEEDSKPPEKQKGWSFLAD